MKKRKSKRDKMQEYYDHYFNHLVNSDFKRNLRAFTGQYERDIMFWKVLYGVSMSLVASITIIINYGG